LSESIPATLQDIQWMVGPWTGELGAQTVEEAWRAPQGGVMSTMITLGSAAGIDMIELIAIREEGDSLVLHLRQFSPALELRHSDDMRLQACDAQSVRFVSPGAPIEGLAYRQSADQTMQVEVTVAGGAVLVAKLQRPTRYA
jgi:hypothetical protein